MYDISYFIGDQTNASDSEILKCEKFEDLGRILTKVRQGRKHSAYWIRGVSKDGCRKDKSMDVSRLLVIDGDSGFDGQNAPDPIKVHRALVEMNLNHFIYTTHSHLGAEKNKFRVVIEATDYKKSDLKANNARILKLLSRKGIKIAYVKEMSSFSQPWFVPTRDDPEDGMFECYEYYKGHKWESLNGSESYVDRVKREANLSSDVEIAGESLDVIYENIRTGKEFHESLRTISYQYIKDGMSKANTVAYLQNLMNGSSDAGTERWQKRYNDLERLVQGAIDKVDEENSADFELESDELDEFDNKKMPIPSGLLGQFIQETKEFMMYEDDTIAFVASMFIVSSICGRKFNVDINNKDGMAHPTALNMYLTLAAETGVGKSEIENAVENCYMQFSGNNGKVMDFFYKGRVTGPRALYRIYSKQRCIGIISNEKGIADQSKLGDQQGLKDAWLNLYGQGAWKKWTGASTLSSDDDSIQSIRAVAISRIGESTPVELRKAYSGEDQVQNGLIPRESIFVIDKISLNPNREIRTEYSPNIINKFNSLIGTCAEDSAEDGLFKPYIISVSDKSLYEDMIKTQMFYRAKQENGETIYERAMSSRMFVKMLRYVGLITVINYPKSLTIKREDWEWAKKVVETEYSNIGNVVALTGGSNEMEDAIKRVKEFYKMCIMDFGRYNNKKIDKAMSPELVKAKWIPLNMARDVLARYPELLAIKTSANSGYVNTPLDKVNQYLERQDVIKISKKVNPVSKRKAQFIQLLEGF